MMQTEESQSFSCPSCGGRMLFDPGTQKLKCPYCETLKDIPCIRVKPNEYDLNTAPTQQDEYWGEPTHVMRCQGCGAEIVLTGETSADNCAFCGAPHVMADQSKAGIAPESVVPFSQTEKQAVSEFRRWLKHKLFAPRKVKKLAALGKISGVYLPHWTYDSDTVSQYSGQEGHIYYVDVPVTVTRNGKTCHETRREQRMDWRPTSGIVSCSFDDIVVPGSNRLPDSLLTRVQPYDMDQLIRYEPEYISGFAAEKPAVDVHSGWDAAKSEIDQRMAELARQDILCRADDARVTSVSSRHSHVKYKLTLLPMYLSAYQYKNKSYHVLVNGQTGRVGGEAPVSALRVCALIVLIAVLIALLYSLFVGSDSGDLYYYYSKAMQTLCL